MVIIQRVHGKYSKAVERARHDKKQLTRIDNTQWTNIKSLKEGVRRWGRGDRRRGRERERENE